MTKNTCWKCLSPREEQIVFKTVCDSCGAYLHCCLGCTYHELGRPNQCCVPNTDPIRDREGFNYCEEFKPAQSSGGSKKPTIDEISKRLFGE